jgi:hypothetical protein
MAYIALPRITEVRRHWRRFRRCHVFATRIHQVDSRAGHSVKHAAELLDLHERSVYRGISSGLIKLCASAASW